MSGLARLVAAGVLREDVSLGPLTTYKAGGPARLFASVKSSSDLEMLIDSGLTREHPLLVIGRGSNLVVADAGFPGLVITLGGELSTIAVEGVRVHGGGGAPLSRVARTAVDAGVVGLEFFVGVPGSVGGAVRQNAGCFGVETKDRLVSAVIVDLGTGDRREATPSDLTLAYRHSNLTPADLVIAASFQGELGDVSTGKELMREITRWRKDNQPGGTLNAGSVFKNPVDTTAGELIDRLGLKGMSVGDVSVSHKHANFFVAGPGANATDIHHLVEMVKDAVFERSGTMLEPEIQFIGFEE